MQRKIDKVMERTSYYHTIRKNEYYPLKGEKLKSSYESVNILRRIYDLESLSLVDRECFIALYLNKANEVIGHEVVSIGGVAATLVDIKILIRHALLFNSPNILVCHNHPSGNTKPSEADKSLTKRIKEACETMDINFLDHVVLTEEGYLSFADEGIL